MQSRRLRLWISASSCTNRWSGLRLRGRLHWQGVYRCLVALGQPALLLVLLLLLREEGRWPATPLLPLLPLSLLLRRRQGLQGATNTNRLPPLLLLLLRRRRRRLLRGRTLDDRRGHLRS